MMHQCGLVGAFTSCAGQATEKVASAFKDEGSVGKQFQDTEEGAAGAMPCALCVHAVW